MLQLAMTYPLQTFKFSLIVYRKWYETVLPKVQAQDDWIHEREIHSCPHCCLMCFSLACPTFGKMSVYL